MIANNINDNKIIELIEKILYTGGIIKTNCHELNHNFHYMYYYHKNGSIPLKTLKKHSLDEREGGKEMELLLFGRVINSLSLKEALYILNENNYKKNIFQFKEDFEKLHKKMPKKTII